MQRLLLSTVALALAFAPAYAGTVGNYPAATKPYDGSEQVLCDQDGVTKACNASDISASGISGGALSVTQGGTGQTTYTNGQILIGNTTGNTLNKTTLTAGSNVSITNGAGSITIGLATSPALVTPQLGVATATTMAGQHAITSITPGGTGQIGTGGTAVCATSHVCDSLSGEVTLTTGTGTLTTGTFFTINFADTRTNIPNCLMHMQTAAVGINSNVYLYSETTSTLTLTGSSTLTASTTYIVDYTCGGN
jgi:hypothetical protein